MHVQVAAYGQGIRSIMARCPRSAALCAYTSCHVSIPAVGTSNSGAGPRVACSRQPPRQFVTHLPGCFAGVDSPIALWKTEAQVSSGSISMGGCDSTISFDLNPPRFCLCPDYATRYQDASAESVSLQAARMSARHSSSQPFRTYVIHFMRQTHHRVAIHVLKIIASVFGYLISVGMVRYGGGTGMVRIGDYDKCGKVV